MPAPVTPSSPELRERLRLVAEQVGGPTALAQALGWSVRTVQNYLSGVTSPPRSKLHAITATLGVDLAWLETGKGTQPRPSADAHRRIAALRRRQKLESREDYLEVRWLGDSFRANPIHVASSSWVQGQIGTEHEQVGSWIQDDSSMAPLVERGEAILLARPATVSVGRLYLLDVGGVPHLRRRTATGWQALSATALEISSEDVSQVLGHAFAKVQAL